MKQAIKQLKRIAGNYISSLPSDSFSVNSEALSQKCVSCQEAYNRENQLLSMTNAKVLVFHPFLPASTTSQPYLNQQILIEHLLHVMSYQWTRFRPWPQTFHIPSCAIAQQNTSGQKSMPCILESLLSAAQYPTQYVINTCLSNLVASPATQLPNLKISNN